MKRCASLFALLISACLTTASSQAQLRDNGVWIDVRSPGEFREDHLPQAVNIPWDGIETGIHALEVTKATPIYLYCASGRRSGIAMERLQRVGYSNVINAGGLEQARQLANPD